MLGNICSLKKNTNGNLTYGFIYGTDGTVYFFHKTELTNCTIFQLEEGDSVEFDINIDSIHNKKRLYL